MDKVDKLAKEIEEKDRQIKSLCADIGSLEFQVSDYQQIVSELTERLKKYENIAGSVFRKKV